MVTPAARDSGWWLVGWTEAATALRGAAMRGAGMRGAGMRGTAGREAGGRPLSPTAELRDGLSAWMRDLAGLSTGLPGRVTVHTLTLTRWVAVTGQLFTILLVHFSLAIPISLRLLIPAVGLSAAVNLVLMVRHRATTRLPERGVAALYGYDILQLCYLWHSRAGCRTR